jgi:hypothetical protein
MALLGINVPPAMQEVLNAQAAKNGQLPPAYAEWPERKGRTEMPTLARIKAEVEEAVQRAEALDFTRQQIELIKHSVLKGGTDLELDLFLNWCRTKGLDPLSGEAYAVRQGGGIQPAAQIAGLRKIAARTGLYGPQDGPYWCGADGEWTDVWLQDEHPLAARVGVKQIGHDAYTYSVAHWNEHGKTKAGRGGPWATQPAHMLAIRAEAAALRRVFPTELGGVYIKDELEQEAPRRAPEPQPLMAPEEYDAVDRAVRQAFASDDEDDVIDAETGEIVQESFVPAPAPKGRMTREQGQLITDIAGQLGWDKAAVQACSGEVTGITNSALLREDQAKDLIEHMLAELNARKG